MTIVNRTSASKAVKRFSALLKRKINAGEITVSELSEKTGLSRQHIYRLMDGEQAPTLTTAETVGKVLGIAVTISDISQPAAS